MELDNNNNNNNNKYKRRKNFCLFNKNKNKFPVRIVGPTLPPYNLTVA